MHKKQTGTLAMAMLRCASVGSHTLGCTKSDSEKHGAPNERGSPGHTGTCTQNHEASELSGLLYKFGQMSKISEN